jgi:transposase-like protein
MPRTRKLTEEQEREVIALYRDSKAPIDELKSAYGLTNGLLYSLLNRHNIYRRKPNQRSTSPLTSVDEQALAELPIRADVILTTDAQGYVQTLERRPVNGKTYAWEVRFESAMRVEAETIQDAIQQVSQLPMCRRVFHVALKGAL